MASEQPVPPPVGDVTTADTAPPAPRVIDENTDMSTLTDQEIMKLVEGMGQEDVTNKPLISAPVPLLVIREEYQNGSVQVLKKLDWLQEQGWDQVWRARGDGDCFYRSFTIAYLLRILHDAYSATAADQALETVSKAMPSMKSCGFDMELAQDFIDPFLDILRSFKAKDTADRPSEYSLIQLLQDPERSNSIVVALRLVTSAYIRTHADQFAPFLFHPITFEQLDENEFCRSEVEPCGKEADQVQITALSEALDVGVRIAYLDRSDVGAGGDGGDVINWVESGKVGERPLTLLYRPGHYDVVTKDHLPTDVPDI